MDLYDGDTAVGGDKQPGRVRATEGALREGEHGAAAHPALALERVGIAVEREGEWRNGRVEREAQYDLTLADEHAFHGAVEPAGGQGAFNRRIVQRTQRRRIVDRDDGVLPYLRTGCGALRRGQTNAASVKGKARDVAQRNACQKLFRLTPAEPGHCRDRDKGKRTTGHGDLLEHRVPGE